MDRRDAATIKDLKDLIIPQLRALYGPKNPTLHTLDIIITRRRNPTHMTYTAQAIAYTSPAPKSFSEWKLLVQSEPCREVLRAVESLWGIVENKMEEDVPGESKMSSDESASVKEKEKKESPKERVELRKKGIMKEGHTWFGLKGVSVEHAVDGATTM
ncbi:hypothetical protein BDV96DRAFT_641513 [Lophiotrema nucula]|uniref:Uncharacterized protein n=1 Tax=Lophiotrema nucula TaxID=690887 RepID=A0A6A5ZN69_9PLEO|nr:hypothetical protein BDV96DRAFT_641513 [Lophiotrema nucula]